MKIRTDFVTNSSSSSFIIAYKAPNKESDEIIRELLAARTDDYFDGTRPARYFGSRDVILDVDEFFGDGDIEYARELIQNEFKELYEFVTEHLDKGYAVAEKRVAYDDSYGDIFNRFADKYDWFAVMAE